MNQIIHMIKMQWRYVLVLAGRSSGHVRKELAPKYAKLLGAGQIIAAEVKNVTKVGSYIDIDIELSYETGELHNSRLWLSASRLQAKAAVYKIKNLKYSKTYIGSTENAKERLRQHRRELQLGNHVNDELLSDFSILGADFFETSILEWTSADRRLEAEARHIKIYNDAGVALYNRTSDGQGIPPGVRSHSSMFEFWGLSLQSSSCPRRKQFKPELRHL